MIIIIINHFLIGTGADTEYLIRVLPVLIHIPANQYISDIRMKINMAQIHRSDEKYVTGTALNS